MPPTPIVDIRNVSYEAGGKTILDGASWKIEQGQHWAVLGPNGSGKTTLLKIACGFLWPNAGGEVYRQGKRFADLREMRRSIGWVSSTINAKIPKKESVLDTVVSGKFAQTGLKWISQERPTAEDYEAAAGYLQQLGCSDLKQRRFQVLSQGEQQKVLIARARMTRPMLIILDEPCAGLDPGARETFLSVLQELAISPSCPALVLVTHHLEEIVPALENLLVLSEGTIIENGRTHEVVSQSLVERAYAAPLAQLVYQSGRYWPIW